MKYLACLSFLACAGVIAAERPGDFAYGIAIDVSGNEALYEVTLPAAVYLGVVRPDLGDLRAFNGAGEVLPHAFRPHTTTRPDAPATVPLTLFPLKAQTGTGVDGLSIRVRRTAGGATSVQVTSAAARKGADKQTVGYLVDLTALERPLRAIELDWQTPAEGFAGKLRVDGSDDLGAWRTLVGQAPLVNLEVAGQHLQQKRIELPQQKVKYLRLSWAPQGPGFQPPELASVRGEPVEKAVAVPREWAAVEPRKGEKSGEYVFDLRGHFPIDRVRVQLPEPNTVAQVELLARTRPDQPWRPITRGVTYRLRQGEGEITSPDLDVTVTTERFWLLRVDQRGGGVGATAPKLETGWVPHRLVFAARGVPPYQLAYGNRKANPAAHRIETLIPGYRDDAGPQISAAKAGAPRIVNVSTAQALEQTELGGETRRREAIDWKRWGLWGALIAGVLILGAMAWRLARQLNTRADASAEGRENKSE